MNHVEKHHAEMSHAERTHAATSEKNVCEGTIVLPLATDSVTRRIAHPAQSLRNEMLNADDVKPNKVVREC